VFSVADLSAFATALAGFLTALQQADASGGPPPGEHNFYRGGRLAVYDQETRDAIRALRGEIDSDAATYVWEAALAAHWDGQPVWVHGDVAPSNLLVLDGRLSAIIDFGCSAVGDPACDLTVTWTFFVGDSRRALHAGMPLDDGTWARARGWALWKALMTLVSADEAVAARTRFGWRLDAAQVVDEVIAEHRRRLAQS
jgi:aminoglycoside phosphotransferase (APT) family kinase protein